MPKQILRVTDLVTHDNPHADELVGFTVLQKWGSEIFPGVQNAKIHRFGGGSLLKAESLPVGYLAVGIGGGILDEHGKTKGLRRRQCSAELVVERLGLKEDRALAKIIRQVSKEDAGREKSTDSISSAIDILYLAGVPFEELLAWFKEVFWAEYEFEQKIADKMPATDLKSWWVWARRTVKQSATTIGHGHKLIKERKGVEVADGWLKKINDAKNKRKELFEIAKTEWREKGHTCLVETKYGYIRIGYTTSDSELIAAAARYLTNPQNSRKEGRRIQGPRIAVLVIKKSTGNAAIFTDSSMEIDLKEVAKKIRIAELKKRNIVVTNLEHLRNMDMEGTHPIVGQWHLLEGVRSMLFNGSRTANCIEPTELTLGEIFGMVKEGLFQPPPKRAQWRLSQVMEEAMKAAAH